MKSTVTKTDSGWQLDGSKLWINNAPIADLGLVLARTDPELGHRGMSIFIVDLHQQGVTRGPKEDKMGQRASNTTLVHFDDVRVPSNQRLGEEGEGFKIAMATLDRARPQVAALAVGIARRALEESR